MTVKISELPGISSANLIAATTTSMPLIAQEDANANVVTYQTSLANLKSYLESGDFEVTGRITAAQDSVFYGNITCDVIIANTQVIDTTTTVSSTSNLIDIQTDANLTYPIVDNGKDVGIRMFYNKTGGNSAALVWKNSTQYLTWYGSTVGNANTTLSGNSVLGTMQVGQLLIDNSTAATANATGALQVSGGISTGGNVYAVGDITANNTTITNALLTGTLRSTATGIIGSTLSVVGIATAQALVTNAYAQIGTTLLVGGNVTANALTVNANSTIGGNLSVVANIVTSHIAPSANGSANIGTIDKLYNTIHAVNFTGTATTAQYADLAEKYEADLEYLPGTVVIFGGTKEITITNLEQDVRVAGVISTAPAYLMNSDSTGLPVALRGKVPVNVVGPVVKGSLLITSAKAGYAKAILPAELKNGCAVVAKSLVEDLNTEPRAIMAVIL